MNINNNTSIDFLPLSFRKLQVSDVITYSQKQHWLSRLVFSIQLLVTGKGWLNENTLKNLLKGQDDVLAHLKTEIHENSFLRTLLKVSQQVDKIGVEADKENPKAPLLEPELKLEPKVEPKLEPRPVKKTAFIRDSLALLSIDKLWKRLETQTAPPDYLRANQVNGRFTDIGCPKDTAIQIGDDYLHANLVGEDVSARRFIAAQAPVEEDYALFWESAWQQEGMIMDLTTAEDRDKGVTIYYPTTAEKTKIYGNFQVELVQESVEEGAKIYQYRMTHQETKESKIIQRVHFDQWLDFNAVSLDHLKTLVAILEKDESGKTPCIHCRAGVGRTGTLITAFILKEKIKNKEIHAGNLESALMDLILKLRRQRGEYFVQQPVQFKLIRDYGKFLLDLS